MFRQGNYAFQFLKKMGLCMFRFDMHMLKSHSHTLQERNLHDWHQEKQEEITEDQCQHRHTKDH